MYICLATPSFSRSLSSSLRYWTTEIIYIYTSARAALLSLSLSKILDACKQKKTKKKTHNI